MVFVLGRSVVHRRRMVAGRDGDPLNEVEMIDDAHAMTTADRAVRLRP